MKIYLQICGPRAAEVRCALHLIDCDHRLRSALPIIESRFRQALKAINA